LGTHRRCPANTALLLKIITRNPTAKPAGALFDVIAILGETRVGHDATLALACRQPKISRNDERALRETHCANGCAMRFAVIARSLRRLPHCRRFPWR
jgi:hypothetical protein